jgi:transcriptional regulator with XRE-family HTH domain
MTRLTNQQFAQRTGRDFTTASKIRNGGRMPGLELFLKIVIEFDLDPREAIVAAYRGREAFKEFVNRTVFDPPHTPEVETAKDAPTEVRFSN